MTLRDVTIALRDAFLESTTLPAVVLTPRQPDFISSDSFFSISLDSVSRDCSDLKRIHPTNTRAQFSALIVVKTYTNHLTLELTDMIEEVIAMVTALTTTSTGASYYVSNIMTQFHEDARWAAAMATIVVEGYEGQ
jgi:hypothetical protein